MIQTVADPPEFLSRIRIHRVFEFCFPLQPLIIIRVPDLGEHIHGLRWIIDLLEIYVTLEQPWEQLHTATAMS